MEWHNPDKIVQISLWLALLASKRCVLSSDRENFIIWDLVGRIDKMVFRAIVDFAVVKTLAVSVRKIEFELVWAPVWNTGVKLVQ